LSRGGRGRRCAAGALVWHTLPTRHAYLGWWCAEGAARICNANPLSPRCRTIMPILMCAINTRMMNVLVVRDGKIKGSGQIATQYPVGVWFTVVTKVDPSITLAASGSRRKIGRSSNNQRITHVVLSWDRNPWSSAAVTCRFVSIWTHGAMAEKYIGCFGCGE